MRKPYKLFVFLALGLLGCEQRYIDETHQAGQAVMADWHKVQDFVRAHTHPMELSLSPIAFFGRSKMRLSHQDQSVLCKLSPVQNKDVVSKYSFDANVVKRLSLSEQIFSPEFTRAMAERYKANVAPIEKITNSPLHHADQWESQQLETQNHDMALWTAREAVNDRIRELISHADSDSGAVRIAHAMKALNGGDDVTSAPSKAPAVSSTGSATAGTASAATSAVAAQGESIPTKVKARLNVLRGQGQVNFTNPVVLTTLNVNLMAVRNSMNQDQLNNLSVDDDPVHLDMKKEFKAVDASSNVKYGFEKRVVSMNLTKKITDQISCVASSDHFTGEQRASDGSKSQQALRMTYSLSF